MARYALDTNLLVYAHNVNAPLHEAAKEFVEAVMNDCDAAGNLQVCLPAQVLVEFLNVITWSRLESPLPIQQATGLVQQYLDTGIEITHPQATQLETLLELLENASSRKKVFDVALAATLKDNGIGGLYTVNTKDFKEFEFFEVVNPLV